jgi:hypothetical protein
MERIIELKNVEVVAETESGIVCRIGARDVEIPTILIQPGSDVWACGDRGALLVPLWLASELGIAPPDGNAPSPIAVRPR